MNKNKGSFEPDGITINYRNLGTISIKEFTNALVEDMHGLEDIFNVRFVKAIKLKLYATNEYGEEIKIYRPTGGRLHYIDTLHYRPACKDYDL